MELVPITKLRVKRKGFKKMTVKEFQEEMEQMTKAFAIVGGFAKLNNFLDAEIASKIKNLNLAEHNFVGLLGIRHNTNYFDVEDKDDLGECRVFKRLTENGILEKHIETQKYKFVQAIPQNLQIDVSSAVNFATNNLAKFYFLFLKNPESITKDNEGMGDLITMLVMFSRLLQQAGTMAGSWTPEIFKKYNNLSKEDQAVFISLSQHKKTYERLEKDLKSSGKSLKKIVQKFLDEGMIEETRDEDLIYMIKPHRDFKNIAWPDFGVFTRPLMERISDFEKMIEELN